MSPELLEKLDNKMIIDFENNIQSNLFSVGMIFLKVFN
jgi:hypothetical protein